MVQIEGEKQMTVLLYIAARLKEPSTYGGLAALLALAHFANAQEWASALTSIGIGIGGILMIVLPEGKAVAALLIAWGLAMTAAPTDALAQARKPGPSTPAPLPNPFTGNPVADIQTAIAGAKTQVQTTIANDLKDLEAMLDTADAITLATQIPGLQDTVGQACWRSMDNLKAVFGAHPVPLTLRLATDLEALRLVAIALNQVCANPNCQAVWQDANNAVTALSVIPAPVSMPAICAKIPAIGTGAAAPTTPVQPAATALGSPAPQ